MIKRICSVILLPILIAGAVACNKAGCDKECIEYVRGSVVVLNVDYETNRFMGGYTLPVDFSGSSFRLEAVYNSPGDFGNVIIYESGSNTKLFAGDIIWMGQGERTYPEEISPLSKFRSTGSTAPIPEFTVFDYTENDAAHSEPADEQYSQVWEAVNKLEIVQKARESVPDATVYLSLYQRSVGVGNPAEWYWLIFIRG